MNIPLNIDWQQILLHLFNFAILAGGLYLLLFKPVKDFMEKRTAYYKQLDEEAKEKLNKANELNASYQEQLANADDEISQKKAKAALESERAAEEQLKNTKKQADKMISDAQKSAKAEREKILAAAQQEIAELAAAAAEKLVQESLDSAYDEFLNAAKGGEVRGEQG